MKTKLYAVLGLSYMIFAICAVSIFDKIDLYNKVEIYPIAINDNLVTRPIQPQILTKHHLSRSEQREVKCLATNMYHEAKGEGHSGWLAVGMVTMNRAVSGRYPQNVCDVVYQGNGKVYQFSWVGTKKALTKPSGELYNRIEELALHIYIHYHVLHDITGGALFFHANHVKPHWSRKMNKTVQIGNHIFYTL